MKTVYIPVPDDVADALDRESLSADLSVADYIMEGLSAGISDGYGENRKDRFIIEKYAWDKRAANYEQANG